MDLVVNHSTGSIDIQMAQNQNMKNNAARRNIYMTF